MVRRATHIDAPEGVTLEPSTMGGYSVNFNGTYVGWIHSAENDQWKAYIRTNHPLGDYLGTYSRRAAIERIVSEQHSRSSAE